MPFENEIVGGNKLLIPAIQSPNYVPNISGWRIARDGSAEFANGLFRGPIVVTQGGVVVASIGAAGNGSFQYATVENDIILQGQSLGERLTDGRGLVGFFGTFGTPTAPGNGTFTSTAWFRAPIQGDRIYFISCTPLRVNNTAFTDEEITSKWVVTDSTGAGPDDLAETTASVSTNYALVQGLLFATSNDPTDLRTVTFALQCSGTSNTLSFTNIGGWNVYCWDVGPLTGAMNNGGLGAPSGTSQRTTIYQASNSQSYDGSGNPFGAAPTDLWQSTFPSPDTHGNTRSICIFPGSTIRSDLTGATIQAAELWLYCTGAEESNGSLGFTGATNTTPPATLGDPGTDYGFDDDWPVPGWFGVSILGGLVNDIVGGDNSIVLPPGLFGLAATKFAGAGSANKPYITITYTK